MIIATSIVDIAAWFAIFAMPVFILAILILGARFRGGYKPYPRKGKVPDCPIIPPPPPRRRNKAKPSDL